MLLALTIQEFNERRHEYLKVSSQAPTRLTVSTFLGGLSFAAFAAILPTAYIPSPGPTELSRLLNGSAMLTAVLDPAWLGTALFAACGVFLGLTSIVFLLATMSTYTALQHQADISPRVVKQLQEGLPSNAHPPDANPPGIEQRDRDLVRDAY